MTVATLETERLLMRALRIDDAEPLFPMYESPEFGRYLSMVPTTVEAMRETVQARLAEPKPPGMGNWVWLDRATGGYVGRGGIWPSIVIDRQPIEMGWFLAVDRWGRGLATEAVRAQLDHTFHDLEVPAVWATIHIDNGPSLRLAERMGFVLKGGTTLASGPHHTLVLER
ncbi:GNAT family N-acetyltransferase [Fodinicola feengrottensis]|uniref:N-acetyltransferase domain-containing protein n=1 Tax=Fodinicola feengrottensis TaxID=435914 RepID=A0ABN2G464_9ACTN|nr:GNAT family N-acetyltransferase [Fodinicola feengrottensis]